MSLQSPVSLDEAKKALQIGFIEDDQYITALLLAATEWSEKFQNRTFVSRTRTLVMDNFQSVIRPPYPPLVSVTSIVYVDTAGSDQTLAAAAYRVDATSEPGRITEAYGYSWPAVRSVTNAVTITYIAGYGNASKVPDDVKAAITLLAKHWYEAGESIQDAASSNIPSSVKSLLWSNRMVPV